MKKISIILILSPLVITLFACNDANIDMPQQQTEQQTTETAPVKQTDAQSPVIDVKQKQEINIAHEETADALQGNQQINKEFWLESKASASDLWEQTQETSSVIWEESKEASDEFWQDGKQATVNFWESTKDQSDELWDDTKENTNEVWIDVKEGSDKIWLDGNEAFEQLFNENESDTTATKDNDI